MNWMDLQWLVPWLPEANMSVVLSLLSIGYALNFCRTSFPDSELFCNNLDFPSYFALPETNGRLTGNSLVPAVWPHSLARVCKNDHNVRLIGDWMKDRGNSHLIKNYRFLIMNKHSIICRTKNEKENVLPTIFKSTSTKSLRAEGCIIELLILCLSKQEK